MTKEYIKEQLSKLMKIESLNDIPEEDAVNSLGQLIDFSGMLNRKDGLELAISLGTDFIDHDISNENYILVNYFLANAWSNLRILTRESKELWEWEQKEIEKEIIHLRRAIDNREFTNLDKTRRCQILTNLGNLFSHVGRFTEAIDYWDKALNINPEFSMALGNKGYGLVNYALSLYDSGHAKFFLKYAYILLERSLKKNDIHEDDKKSFESKLKYIKSLLNERFLEDKLSFEEYSLGDTEKEKDYRRWCLENRLFLNPLNDLGNYTISGRDIFNLPDIKTGIYEGPYYLGFFNQMKQEYVSARYFFYEGKKNKETHFSDKDVFLYNTLDYPVYGLRIEKIKSAYRMIYSLFDKIGYFLTDYFNLEIKRKVYFSSLWYWNEDYNNDLKEELVNKENWPLRGLFWLSKDLLAEKNYKEAIDPDARKIATIRNHLEHKYLKLHDIQWDDSSNETNLDSSLKDSLAFSMYRKEFERKTLKLLKLARAALIYLSLGVHIEEIKRQYEDKGSRSMPIQLDKYDDDWKV